jgi:uncharacterized protein YndB with AHSA1/START domain
MFPDAADEAPLEIRRTFNASRERVFAAWTKAEEIQRWSAPGEMTVPSAEVDLRVGGRFRILMQAPDGTQHHATGVYRVIDPPSRLVYTWSWEERPVITDTIVSLEFIERGATTELVLRHELLPSEEERTHHERGWIGCLDKLSTII